ncbi:MAG: hypothetical protein NVSMB3_06620 [Acidobacteriaceae bacterium]
MKIVSWTRMAWIFAVGAAAVASAAAQSSEQKRDTVRTATAADQDEGSAEQTEADEYTRYELLDPASHSFHIDYEVTATRGKATVFYNPIRKGSVATDEAVFDAMTGKPLHFEVVSGQVASKDPLMPKADLQTDYIRVELGRPVPPGGEGRLRIVKTYTDPKSYFAEGNRIVFRRGLGIARNRVVLPAGYEVVGCNVPTQILMEADGRIGVSFMHAGSGEAPLVLQGARGAQTGAGARPHAAKSSRSWESPFEGETEATRLSERAHQDRKIVYLLQAPGTNAFDLYHDYTEVRPGMSRYVNVVRSGSVVSDPWAYVLDTGERLETKVMTAAQMLAAKIDAGEPVKAGAQVVVISFPPVIAGQSLRLRIGETYTAPASYRLEGDELVFDRSLGRPRNAVVLPAGWYVTSSAEPATVSQMRDGRIRLDFWDDRPEATDVLVKGRLRAGADLNQSTPTSEPTRKPN